MKKQDLLKYFDDALMEKLFGFCYARTKDSFEAEELCSDIVYALVKAANKGGEIESVYPFIWRVARNVYADFTDKKRKHSDTFYEGDGEEFLLGIADEEEDESDSELLRAVYRRIAFLTRAYRDVMIMFYLEGIPTAEIAKVQKTSETAVRQRLFSARQKIRNEVEEMKETYNMPVALDNINYIIWGTGNPGWCDPRTGWTRMLSNHIIWLCRKKPRTAAEVAEELNVPTLYVEEEMDILCKGANGKYGLLRKLENGKYIINFVLFEKEVFEKANELYTAQLPKICETIEKYIEAHKEEYLAFPYLNKKVDMNLILWQQVFVIADAFSDNVKKIMAEKYFAEYKKPERPFSVFGYVDNGKRYGGGWDGVEAQNVCGYKYVHLDNIYITRIKPHFHCGLNVSTDPQVQLALRAIGGIPVASLAENEKEHAAKAIEQGYIYREGDTLYTKILVFAYADRERLFSISGELKKGYFEKDAEAVAEKLAALIKASIPEHLLGEWGFANSLANMPVLDAVVEALIEKGLLTPPENGVGAEGCWMCVEK
ncbi:MAG: sigma-70 family RNA polymerase sigma factor [Clostridia bacterium]|nr:sigma-70 family RNA polymerase sigma factor [Clostridia bacterium]